MFFGSHCLGQLDSQSGSSLPNHHQTLPFCLGKKRSKNPILTLIVNYRKIVQKNRLWHSKQQ